MDTSCRWGAFAPLFGERGKMELKKLQINEIIPYENNPRNNDDAVDFVAESIRQCTYVAPIIVDENYVVLAGHTRLKALKKTGITECECLIKTGLTDEQKRKYRLLDNKTNEFANWDYEALKSELLDLDFDGLELDWGIDDNIAEQEKQRESIEYMETISVVIDCATDIEAEELFYKLQKEGYKCRISTL